MAIHIESDFTVPAPLNEVWDYMLDPRQVAPCMPGADLTEVLNDRQYRGRVQLKMGPVSLSFKGEVEIIERDEAARRIVMKAAGSEQKGKGQANATVTTLLEPSGNGTRVRVSQDLDLSGAMAQYGRGMIQDVTNSLMRDFAGCIQARLSGEPVAAGATAKPLKGFSLGWMAFKSAVVRFFKKLFGGGGA